MRSSLAAAIAALLLAGCASLAPSLDDMSADQLCAYYRSPSIYHDKGAIMSKLLVRGILKASDFPDIDRNQVRVGMSRCEVYASWGRPGDISTYSSALGRSEVLTYYRTGLYGPEIGSLVYMQNGQVSGISQL